MSGLARFVLRHKAWVAAFWLVALIAGGATSSKTVSRLIVDFSLPGQPGYETSKQILATYGNGTDYGATVVAVTAPSGPIAAHQQDVERLFTAVEHKYPIYRVLSPYNSGGKQLVTKDGRTAYGVVVDKRFGSFADKGNFVVMKPLLQEQAKATGLTVRTTGYVELDQGSSSDSSSGCSSSTGGARSATTVAPTTMRSSRPCARLARPSCRQQAPWPSRSSRWWPSRCPSCAAWASAACSSHSSAPWSS